MHYDSLAAAIDRLTELQDAFLRSGNVVTIELKPSAVSGSFKFELGGGREFKANVA